MIYSRSKILVLFGVVLVIALLCSNLQTVLVWLLCWQKDIDRPPHTEVIVSACRSPVAYGVPGGDALFVRENRPDTMYLLDLHTGIKREIPDDPLLLEYGIFLNSELVWLEGSLVGPSNPDYRPHYILDLNNGQHYELLDLDWLPRLEGGKFNPEYYAYFQSAEKVFIHHTENTVIALSSDFRQNPNGRVILSQYSIDSSANAEKGKLLEQLMKDFGVDYEIVDLSTTRYADLPSPSGQYVIRNDGIYLSGTNTPVVTREYTGGFFMGGYFKGWYYDESGVIVQPVPSFLISNSLLGSHFPIPEPILKLRLPETP